MSTSTWGRGDRPYIPAPDRRAGRYPGGFEGGGFVLFPNGGKQASGYRIAQSCGIQLPANLADAADFGVVGKGQI